MGKKKPSKYRAKQERKQKEEVAEPVQQDSLAVRYRNAHKETFLWEAIPLYIKGTSTPKAFPKLSAFLPCRTRDGRVAYLEEIDPTNDTCTGVICHIADPERPGKYIRQTVSLNGMFRADGQPCAIDVLNISAKAWNKKYEEGLVGIRAIDDTV